MQNFKYKEFKELKEEYEKSIKNLLFITQKISNIANSEQTDSLLITCQNLNKYVNDVLKSQAKVEQYLKFFYKQEEEKNEE